MGIGQPFYPSSFIPHRYFSPTASSPLERGERAMGKTDHRTKEQSEYRRIFYLCSMLQKIKLEESFILLLLVGYVFVSGLAIPLRLDEESRWFSVPYRLLVAGMSLLIMYRNRRSALWKHLSVVSFFLFWVFYTAKAVYSFGTDYYLPDFIVTEYEIYARLLLIVILPSAAAMMVDYSKLNLRRILVRSFWVLFAMIGANLLYGIITYEPAREFELKHIFTVYYISYGHIGTSLCLVALYFLWFEPASVREKIAYAVALLLGLFTIVEGSARSPFLALAVCVAYLLLVKRSRLWSGLAVGSLVLFGAFMVFYSANRWEFLPFINRTYNWLAYGDNSLRTPLFEYGRNIFKESPLIGGRVLFEDGSYPHNLFLELLMATGLVGFILYFLKFIPVVRYLPMFFARTKAPNRLILLFALFLQYFVLVLTSYPLFGTPEFLHFSGIIIGVSLTLIYEKTKSNDGRGYATGDYPLVESDRCA